MTQEYLNLISGLSGITESPVKAIDGELLGWHSTISVTGEMAIGGGTSLDKNTARQIALAETLERILVDKLKNSSEAEDFLITKYNSSCGFAAGFENEPTSFRALAEGLERWAWSKWIDEKFSLPKVSSEAGAVTGLAKFYSSKFDSYQQFQKIFRVSVPGYGWQRFKLGIVICKKGGGVFPGSKVCMVNEDPWAHAFTEAWRHLNVFENFERYPQAQQLPFQRLLHFGNDGDSAIKQIPDPNVKSEWPDPKILLWKSYDTQVVGVFL